MTTSPILHARSPGEPAYTYRDLDQPASQIRLLHLQKLPDKILSSLVIHSCAPSQLPNVAYEAVSWRWNNPPNTNYTLILEDAELGLTTNMFHILSQLLPTSVGEERYLWIDCICINQSNKAEVQKQLPLMTAIYRNAVRVVVFPTEWGVNASQVQSFIKDLSGYVFRQVQFPRNTSMFPLAHRADLWLAMIDLLRQSVWSRAWIIQELVVARSVKVIYGGTEIPFDAFRLTTMPFKAIGDGPFASSIMTAEVLAGLDHDEQVTLKKGIDFVARLGELQLLYRDGKMLDISDLLVQCVQSEATNPLDKVWALLGILNRLTVPGLEPDYNISEAELYTKITIYALQNDKESLYGLFGIAGHNNFARPGITLPSWVPDLAVSQPLYPLSGSLSPYTVGNRIPSRVEIGDTKGEIRVQGIAIDLITYIIKTPHPLLNVVDSGYGGAKATANFDSDMCREVLDWIWSMLEPTTGFYERRNKSAYVNAQPFIEAIIRSLICDFDGKNFPASESTLISITRAIWCMCTELYQDDKLRKPYDEQIADQLLKVEISRRSAQSIDDTWSMLRDGSFISRAQSDGLFTEPSTPEHIKGLKQAILVFLELLAVKMSRRRFALSELGFMLLIPEFAREGDMVVVFGQAKTPHLLRKKGSADQYELVGEAYAHAFMDGKVVDHILKQHRSRSFTLV